VKISFLKNISSSHRKVNRGKSKVNSTAQTQSSELNEKKTTEVSEHLQVHVTSHEYMHVIRLCTSGFGHRANEDTFEKLYISLVNSNAFQA